MGKREGEGKEGGGVGSKGRKATVKLFRKKKTKMEYHRKSKQKNCNKILEN